MVAGGRNLRGIVVYYMMEYRNLYQFKKKLSVDLTRDSRSWATCTYEMRSSYRAGCTVTKNRLIDD
jgi:hypothetical protein